jgi:hypothetical protein
MKQPSWIDPWEGERPFHFGGHVVGDVAGNLGSGGFFGDNNFGDAIFGGS